MAAPQAERSLLSVEGLRAGFGSNAVLHGVTFSVADGEIAAILGLNGAGKSVTMKVLAGVVPAWEGVIALGGERLDGLDAEDRVARGIGHVTQGRQVFPDLTVEENLRLGAYLLRKRDRGAYAARLAEVFERFPRLGERRTQAAGTLSGGEQAMLALGRALIAQPRLLLIDEPTAGLAPVIVEGFLEALREVNASGVTMLLVEQNVPFAMELAHTVHVMARGRIAYSSPIATFDRAEMMGYLGIGRLLAKPAAQEEAPARRAATRKARVQSTPKPAARKAAAKKAVPADAAVKRTAKKAPAKKAAAKKTAAKKTAAKKTAAKKAREARGRRTA